MTNQGSLPRAAPATVTTLRPARAIALADDLIAATPPKLGS